MKLKNFIKKTKKEKRGKKTFHANKKFSKKPTRADEKKNTKKNKRIFQLSIIGLVIFIIALILSAGTYFYNSFLLSKLNNEIVSPGEQFVFETDSARDALGRSNIDIASLNYSSESGTLTLVTNDSTTVYFSDTVEFESQVETLKKIILNLNSEGRKARSIDFRYNRPIVKF